MLSRFFINRPVFAWVIAIAIMLAGALAIRMLPIAQYPSIAPPAVFIHAAYPGASAETVQNSVTEVIEQQLKGLDHLLYFTATSAANGEVDIQATFEAGTNPDIAQVQVQNKLQQATPLLPQEVQQQGIQVGKANAGYLLIAALYDTSGRYSDADLGDYMNAHLVDPISRVDGVGDIQTFASQYAMRIWLDPYKLNYYKLMPSDVSAAIQAQNVQVAAGEIGGQPSAPGQALNASITAQSRLQTPDQFRAIVLRTQPDGSLVRLSDVARVELGAESYDLVSRLDGLPAAGLVVQLAPGANALATADAVKKRTAELARDLPPGLKLRYPLDSTTFVKLSIRQVIITLVEAILLVVAVMFLFLQNWRATLIPAITVPVVLLGVFAVLAAFGYSINTLTMFAMVLAIGLLVDDAIVVVENVERIMRTEGLGPKEATAKSMTQITGALIGIGLALSAVFLPMAFFGGSTGVIYRQFSITIIAAMVLSIVVALVLTPALCATLLRPIDGDHPAASTGFFGWFNRTFARGVARYDKSLSGVIARPLPATIVYIVVLGLMALLFVRLPTGFLPEEDQGAVMTVFTLPSGAIQARSVAVAKQIEHHYLHDEKGNIDTIFVVVGFSFAGTGQNVGLSFAHLTDWSQRPGAANRAQAIATRAIMAFSKIRDGQVFALVPPAVIELGNTSGFDLELEDQGGVGHARLLAARDQLLRMAASDPLLVAVRQNGQDDTPQLHIDVDQARAGALGLAQSDINSTLSAAAGPSYINDFIDRGRVKRVFMEGDAPFRSAPTDLGNWYVRGASGEMAPFSAFSTQSWLLGPAKLDRYNGLPAIEIQGQGAPGQSSGAAMKEMAKLTAQLPAGIGYEWTGLSYQEQKSGAQAPPLYALSILVVFLTLAALYESWSIPMSVLMVIPLGVVGALLAATLRGLYDDVYFQVGLLTTIGLVSKNAILIVEFADKAEQDGENPVQAALQAARLRLRPILMTSLAFVAGVLPLALTNGPGANSQHDIGTGVIGGMISATALAIFFVPLFFVGVRQMVRRRVAQPVSDSTGVGDVR